MVEEGVIALEDVVVEYIDWDVGDPDCEAVCIAFTDEGMKRFGE